MQYEKRTMVGVRVKAVPLPKAVARAQVATEFATWCCEKCRHTAWEGVSRGLVKTITMYGVDKRGEVRDMIRLEFSDDNSGTVTLDTGNGASPIDGLDRGLGRALRVARESLRRRGLTPTARYGLHDYILNDPVLKAEAYAILRLKPTPIGPWADGCEPREVLRIRPGKDDGVAFSFFRGFRSG